MRAKKRKKRKKNAECQMQTLNPNAALVEWYFLLKKKKKKKEEEEDIKEDKKLARVSLDAN